MYAKQGTPVETDDVVGVSFVSCMLFKEAPSTHGLCRVSELKKGTKKISRDLLQGSIIKVNKWAKEIIKQGRKFMHGAIDFPHSFSDLIIWRITEFKMFKLSEQGALYFNYT